MGPCEHGDDHAACGHGGGRLRRLTFDDVAEVTAVTSNPAAGVTSVDVKTFTGRGRVTAIVCTALADANVATRLIKAQRVSAAGAMDIALGAGFSATQTGVLQAARGWQTAQVTLYCAIAQCDFAPGDILRVLVANGQAGDDMSAITYSYKELPA